MFLLSLPRAGSTLVQRVLSRSPEVSTASEPWILLPVMYALRKDGVLAEYGHKSVYTAVADFNKTLCAGSKDYFAAVRKFAMHLYEASGKEEACYFLDKTPRNSLIIPELLQTFPDAKFIVLWRNPLAVAASIIETFGIGRWNIYRFEIDLYKGLSCLLNFAKGEKFDKDQVLFIKYENFVQNPEESQTEIRRFLDLSELTNKTIDLKADVLQGRMGDLTGVKRYASVSTDSIDSWINTFSSAPRKKWAQNYLAWLGEENLHIMGYDLREIAEKLDGAPTAFEGCAYDLIKMGYGYLYCLMDIPALKAALSKRDERRYPCY